MLEYIKNKLTLVAAIIFAAMVLCVGYLLIKNKHLQFDYEIAMNNYKAYEQMATAKYDSVNARNYELKLTKEMLEYSNDSIIRNLNELRKELKIKDKNIQRLEYILTQTTTHDSIYFTDTIFNYDVNVDTTLADKWRVLNLKLKYPNTIDIKSTFNNELSVIVSGEKQTINPPSKIFFIRWFQKKQTVVKIDVVDTNPYSSVREQRFVEIVK